MANVTAVFRKGKKTCPSKYRPISLTVSLCEILESIIRDKVIDHLQKYKLIKDIQHGFVNNKSCLTNLLVYTEEITCYLDSGFQVDVIYLDSQKAFHKFRHRRLIHKLAAHEICGDVLQWIENWLVGRQQRVLLNEQFSSWRKVISGVPQGSVLGPLLFVIYINDIHESVACRILKFADDTNIYSAVKTSEDIDNLQADLRNLVSWSKEWLMLFNVDKCKVVCMGYNNQQANYAMDGNNLESVSEERDLGVIVSEDLK